MKLHLIDTDNPSNLFLDSINPYLYFKDDNGGRSKPKLLIITDDSEIKPGDFVYEICKNSKGIGKVKSVDSMNVYFEDNRLSLIKEACRKIIASSSPELTPNHLVSDKDLRYIVDYWNKNKVLPEGSVDNFGTFCTHNNNEVVIEWEEEIMAKVASVAEKTPRSKAANSIRESLYEPTIKSVTHCPTCGSEVDVNTEGETHFYVPKTKYGKPDFNMNATIKSAWNESNTPGSDIPQDYIKGFLDAKEFYGKEN